MVSQALEALTLGKSQFLTFEGSPGSGKTLMLETVGRNLADHDLFHVVSVAGSQQEAFRPYHLTTAILVDLLNQREGNGADIFATLEPEQIGYLSNVLPHLEDKGVIKNEDEPTWREEIFRTLIEVLTKALDYRPLILLLDDLQFADEASLLMLGAMIQRDEPRLFVCGSSTESMRLSGEEESVPFDRFCSMRQKELDIRRVKLDPLGADDIAAYLRSVFPGLKMPKGFEHDLVDLTQGNPLFTSEIIRKLVSDQKVQLVGQNWTMESLEDDYLPRSLEESVMAEIAALDEEERQLLERASMFGEDVSLSVLMASSEQDESRVLDFLDRAEALGLVKSRFELNDETMRFLGKRVLDISYGTIDEKRRQALHEEVGTYQETLYEKGVAPSASLLAYHFKRSANQEKAQQYERLQQSYSLTVFGAQEAATYTGAVEEEIDVDERLDLESQQKHVPVFFRSLVTAARSTQLYPADSAAVVRARAQLKDALDGIFEWNTRLSISQVDGELAVNGQKLDATGFKGPAESLLELMARAQLQGLVFDAGVGEEELLALLNALGHLRPETIGRSYWKDFSHDNSLQHIDTRQLRYSEMRRGLEATLSRSTSSKEALQDQDLAEIPNILRDFNRAVKNIKLYPLDTKPVSDAIGDFYSSLCAVLGRHQTLSFSAVEGSLLANGQRLNTADYESLADSYLDFMRESNLHSITFLANVTEPEIGTFIDGLRDLPDEVEDEHWFEFTKQAGLRGLFLNEHQYALKLVQSMLLGSASADSIAGEIAMLPEGAMVELSASSVHSDLAEAVPRFGKELLVSGQDDLFRQLLNKLFNDFKQQDASTREEIVKACGRLLHDLTLALQRKYGELAADPLVEALATEQEPRVLHELATILHLMAGTAVQFSDYQSASRLFLALDDRRKEIESRDSRNAQSLAKILDRSLDPTVQQLLEDDLKSGEPERQEKAARVLGGVGRPGMALLIEVIKQEKDFRVRQMAASLLAEMGPRASEQIKKALNLEVTVEQRFRILEVVDIITKELRDEIAYSLGDGNPKIRRAAFRLAERLHDDQLIDILTPFAASNDPGVVKGTIRSLASMRSNAAAVTLASILETLKDPELLVACCQALGQIGDAAGIDELGKILSEKRFGFLGFRWNDQARATAALALRQMNDPRAASVLQGLMEDRDARIRQLSRGANAHQGSPEVPSTA